MVDAVVAQADGAALTDASDGIPWQQSMHLLLCQALHQQPGELDWDSVESLGWNRFAFLAQRHGVAGILYWRYKNGELALPQPLLKLITPLYLQNMARELVIERQQKELLALLSPQSEPPVILKGSGLRASIYPAAGTRCSNDIDLLVRPQALKAVLEGIRSGDYVLESASYHVVMSHPRLDYAPVEVHWNWIGDAFWRKQPHSLLYEEIAVGSQRAQVLAPTPNLLFLLDHLIKHLWSQRLIWYYDIHRLLLVQGERIDWALFLQAAEDCNMLESALILLKQVQEKFGTPLPAEIESQQVMARLEKSAKTLHDYLYQRSVSSTSHALQALPWAVRWYVLMQILLPSRAYISWRYRPKQPWMWFLYYPVRWGNMLYYYLTHFRGSDAH